AKGNIKQTLANLNAASSSLTRLLNDQTGALAKTLSNAYAITENLKKNGDSITETISNAKKISQKLSELNLQTAIDSVHVMLSELKKTVAKISSNDGTLGALINDKALYNKLNDVLLSAEILLDDLRAHPKRYVNLSVFGKKDKDGPLTSPAKKDSVPTGNK
ncbi:MAG: MCE family protein, partial [Chitinophagaceae bacterium]